MSSCSDVRAALCELHSSAVGCSVLSSTLLKTNRPQRGNASEQMAPKVKRPLYSAPPVTSPVKKWTMVDVRVVKSSSWAVSGESSPAGSGTQCLTPRPDMRNKLLAPDSVLNKLPARLDISEQSSRIKSEVIHHDRFDLTWKVFCVPLALPQNKNALSSTCCWQLCCFLPTSNAFVV